MDVARKMRSFVCTTLEDELLYGDRAYEYYLSNEEKCKTMREGKIRNFDQLEKFWQHIFQDLNVQSDELYLIYTDTVNTSEHDRIKMTEILFEKYNIQGKSALIFFLFSIFFLKDFIFALNKFFHYMPTGEQMGWCWRWDMTK